MSKPKFIREPIVTKHHGELFNPGPVRDEARRLARIAVLNIMRKKGIDPAEYTEVAIQKVVTIMIFNSADHYLKLAKFNLSERR